MKANKTLIICLILLLALAACLLAACNKDEGGNGTDLSTTDAITTDFEDKKTDPPSDDFNVAEYLASIEAEDFPVDQITEAKAEYYTGVSAEQANGYLAKYAAKDSGWTQIAIGIYFKGRTVVFIDYAEADGKLQITNMTVTEAFAKEINNSGEGEVRYSYDVTRPTKTQYAPGETLDLTGFKIVKSGSDGSEVTLVEGTDYTIDRTGFNTTLTEGQTRKSIYLPYADKTGSNYSGSIMLEVVKPDDVEFVGAAFANASKTYDGTAISATLTHPTGVAGYMLQYCYSENMDNWTAWSLTNPSFTEPCFYNVRVKISKDGYSDKELYATVSIRPATFANATDLERDLFSGYYGTYDGNAHGGTQNVEITVPDGATVEFGEEESWSATAPTYTEIGFYSVSYRITKNGYSTVYGSYSISIGKQNIAGVEFSYMSGISYAPNKAYADISVLQGETFFSLNCSNEGLIPLTDVFKLNGTQAGDVVKYSTDGGTNWSTTAPAITSSGRINLKVFRGETAETDYTITVAATYISSTAVDFDNCGLEVRLVSPFNGENYSVAEDSGVAPFSPYVTAMTDYSVLLVRSSADNGATWKDWTKYGGSVYEATNEYSEAGTYKYEYKYYKTGSGLCTFEKTFIVDP